MTPAEIKTFEDFCDLRLRKDWKWPTIYGFLDKGKLAYDDSYGCFGGLANGLRNYYKKGSSPEYFLVPFPGYSSGAPGMNSFATISTVQAGGTYYSGKPVYNEKSLAFVQYLLSEDSPWKEIHPYIVNKDPEYVNHYGWIFEKLDEIPFECMYNFLMAQRNCYEYSSRWSMVLELSKVMGMRQAFFIGFNFNNFTFGEYDRIMGRHRSIGNNDPEVHWQPVSGRSHMFFETDAWNFPLFLTTPKKSLSLFGGRFAGGYKESIFNASKTKPNLPNKDITLTQLRAAVAEFASP